MINEGPVFQNKHDVKKKKKAKKRLFWIKSILLLVVFLTTIILLALSPLFNVTGIEVRGNSRYKADEIINATDLVTGKNGFKIIGGSPTNILTLRYGKAEQSIKNHYPYVKNAVVRFSPPNKFKISITERTPFISAEYSGQNLLVDKEGFVLEIVDTKKTSGFIIVKGMQIDSFELGQAFKLKKPECFDNLLKIIEIIDETDKSSQYKLKGKISFIDISDSYNIKMMVDKRITVNLGNLQDLRYRLEFMKQIVFEKLGKNEKGYLDLTLDKPNFKSE